MAKSLEVSPLKSLAQELDILRNRFRQSVDGYAAKIETDLQEVQTAVISLAKVRKLSPNQIRDLRDMLTLCRTLDVKAEKARRKDLKKFETIVDEFRTFVQGW